MISGGGELRNAPSRESLKRPTPMFSQLVGGLPMKGTLPTQESTLKSANWSTVMIFPWKGNLITLNKEDTTVDML